MDYILQFIILFDLDDMPPIVYLKEVDIKVIIFIDLMNNN